MTTRTLAREISSLGVLVCALACAACGSDDPSPTPERGWHEAFDASETGWLLSTWGPSRNDQYAVGGTEAEGRVEHYDGKSWSRLELGVSTPLLNWVHGFGSDDVTIVGNAGTVLHLSNGVWTKQTTPTDQNLWGVWGATPSDLWSVGGSGKNEGDATVLHFDGTTWTQVTLPKLAKAGVMAFFKVWGTSADNVYVVGQAGAVLHYDGTSWKEELVGASSDLIAVWGTGPSDVVAVGGRAIGSVSRWDGSSWHTESLGPLPGLNGVWTRKPGTVHVVGVAGTLGVLHTADWSFVDHSRPIDLDVHGVFASDGGPLVAVGGNFAGAVPPYRGIALERRLESDE